VFIVSGIGFAVAGYYIEREVSGPIQFWRLLGGVFMGLVSFSLAQIMKIVFDMAVQLGMAEAAVDDLSV
jgi:hypothetical protein